MSGLQEKPYKVTMTSPPRSSICITSNIIGIASIIGVIGSIILVNVVAKDLAALFLYAIVAFTALVVIVDLVIVFFR